MPGNGVGPVKGGAQTDRAQNDTASVLEDAVVSIDVLANDGGGNNKQLYSLNQGNLQIQTPAGVWVTLPSGARVRFQNNLIEYDAGALDHLAAGAAIIDTFIYSIRLNNGTVSSANVAVTVTGLNDAPIAAADTADGSENQVLTIDVLANDSDVDDGAVLTVTAASGPAGKGSVSIVGNQLSFNPGTDFDHLAQGATEQVVLAYTVADEKGATSRSTVIVTVTGTNDGPVATPDTGAGTENQVLRIDALSNDSDVDDGAVMTLVTASTPAGKGSASIVEGQIQFNPGTDFDHLAQGAAEIVVLSYTMKDQQGATSSSFVTITVTGTNDGPVANTDSATTAENSSISIDVLANDTDSDDGRILTVTAASGPIGEGSASIVGNQVLFNPGVDFDALAVGESGNVVVSYSIQDELGATSGSTATITVTGANDAPVANPDTATGTENQILTIDALANDTDIDNGAIKTLASAAAPTGKGIASIVANQIQFNPSSDFDHLAEGATETVLLNYTVQDERGATSTSTITITVTGTNDGPVATADTAAVAENGSVTTDVLGNDTDVDDGAALSVTAASTPSGQGSVAVIGNQVEYRAGNAFDYLAAGETANVVISYEVQDEHGVSATSTATITVIGTNNAPTIDAGDTAATTTITEVANGDPGEGTTTHEANGVVAFNDVDLSDLHSASATAQSAAYLGSFLVDRVNQNENSISWHFNVSDAELDALEAGEIVTQTYVITVSDGQGGTANQNITITLNGAAENTVPEAVADSATTSEDVSVTINVLANDVDSDGDPLIAEIVSGPSNGTLTRDALTGSYLYQPAANFHGDDLFTYRVSDPSGAQSDIVAVSITIVSVNDPPLVTQIIGDQLGHVLQLVSVILQANLVVDDDGSGNIAYSATLASGAPLPAWLSFDPATATFSGTPGTADMDRYSIRVTGAEEDGQAASTSFILTVIDGDAIDGTSNGEIINGTVRGDYIRAFDGSDTVNASAGDDLVDGGTGSDQLNGEAGDDLLQGGDGNDVIRGGDGADRLLGGDGNDRLNGDNGNDVIDGGPGDDRIEDRPGSNVLLGGAGNDHIELYTFNNSQTADGGDGNDVFVVFIRRSPTTITTGAGVDRIYMASPSSYTASGVITVTDFTPGAGGDLFSLMGETSSDPAFLSLLAGWDGSSNPFGSGYLRLIQSGSDSLLQWDEDGPANGASWTTLAVFQNTDASAFTGENFGGYPPDGSQPAGLTIIGTEAGETLIGTIGGDTISGLDGDDFVNAGASADVVDGGPGNDRLNGEAGADLLQGGDGTDTLRGGDGSDHLLGGYGNDYLNGDNGNDVIDGGPGDDRIEDRPGSNLLLGGAGNDHIELYTFNNSQTADGGEGDDVFVVFIRRSPTTITTGAGVDRIYMASPNSYNASGIITVTDFTPGAGGDIFSLMGETSNDPAFLSILSGWDGSSNPFGSGFLRLIQSGSDSLLQWDQDGPANGAVWTTLALFQKAEASTFTAANFGGYPPDGSQPAGITIVGTGAGETIVGTIGGDTISGLGGDDFVNAGASADVVDGGSGNDQLNGEAGDDLLQGGDGNDVIRGGDGADQLLGGDGNDRLNGDNGNDVIDGGAGDDILEDRPGSNVLLGGAGNDHIELYAFHNSQIADGGDGNDVFSVFARRSPTTITTGAGIDRVYMASPSSYTASGVITVTDFTPGAGGDLFSLMGETSNDPAFLSLLSGWDGSSNPFGSGYLQLIQSGSDSLLQWDGDGPANGASWTTLAVFQNTDASTFTGENFAPGYDPTPEDGDSSSAQANELDNSSASSTWFETERSDVQIGSFADFGSLQILFTTDQL